MFIRRLVLPFAISATLLGQEPSQLDRLVMVLGKIESPAAQANILRGMKDSLQGQRGLAAPQGWTELYAKLKESPDEAVRANAQALAVIFGGGGAMDAMRGKLLDAAVPVEQRRQAMDSLVAQRDAGALEALLQLAVQPGALREPALRGLAGYEDARVAGTITGVFAKLDSTERRAAVQTLLARASGAKAFVAAMDAGVIAKAELSAPLARQMQGLKEPALDAWLTKNWGAVNAPTADKQKEIGRYKEFLHPDLILRADVNHGRALFAQTCAACHTLFGIGGRIGPELPGSFDDLDYLLNNVLDPNAIIGKDYQQTFVKTKDGQTFAGIVAQDNDRALTLRVLGGEPATIQRADIASTELSPQSMMPEGLLTPLHEDDVRDLFLYLRQKQQAPMLVTAVNANDFFNGTDLRNWIASSEAWRVEKGEIVAGGNAKPESLTSEFVAGDYRLSAQVLIRGDKAAVELVISGERDAQIFHGTTFSFGGASVANLWDYPAAAAPKSTPSHIALGDGKWHSIEVVRKGESLSVKVDGKVEFKSKDTRHRRRVAPAFWLQGQGAQLRVKALQIEAL